MSLEQKSKKIKPPIQLLVSFLLFLNLGLGVWIGLILQQKDQLKFIFDAFEANFSFLDPDFIENFDFSDKIIVSKSGTKYYFSHCGGVNRIKPENRVFFDSEKDAIEGGYELAKNCEKR
jgi:hypothetical protein